MPSSQDPGVHVDIEISQDSDPLISLSDFVINPLFKLVTNHGKDDVTTPSLWHLLQLFESWEVVHNLVHGGGLFDDKSHLQRLVLRYSEGLYVVIVNKALGPRYKISHEILKNNREVRRAIQQFGF